MLTVKRKQIDNIRADITAIIDILEAKGYNSIMDYIQDKNVILLAFMNICVPHFTENDNYSNNNILAMEILSNNLVTWANALPDVRKRAKKRKKMYKMELKDIRNNFEKVIRKIEQKGYTIVADIFPEMSLEKRNGLNDEIIMLAFSSVAVPSTLPKEFSKIVDEDDYFVEIYKNCAGDIALLNCVSDLLAWSENLPDMRKGGV